MGSVRGRVCVLHLLRERCLRYRDVKRRVGAWLLVCGWTGQSRITACRAPAKNEMVHAFAPSVWMNEARRPSYKENLCDT